MGKKYIKVLVLKLVSITQFIQCTILSSELPMGNSNSLPRHQDGSERGIKEQAEQGHQEYTKVCCIDLYALFEKGKAGLEKCIKGDGAKASPIIMSGNKHSNSDCYHAIALCNEIALSNDVVVLEGQYPKAGLERIRQGVHDLEGFKSLIAHLLAQNYKVVVFASIEYPACIPLVLGHVIGLTKEQLSSIYMIFNGFDANNNSAGSQGKHIVLAEREIGIKGKGGNGLVVSSLAPSPESYLGAAINYICMDLNGKSQSNNSVSTSSYWSRLIEFEMQRYRLMQKMEKDKEPCINLNNQLWSFAEELALSVSFFDSDSS